MKCELCEFGKSARRGKAYQCPWCRSEPIRLNIHPNSGKKERAKPVPSVVAAYQRKLGVPKKKVTTNA